MLESDTRLVGHVGKTESDAVRQSETTARCNGETSGPVEELPAIQARFTNPFFMAYTTSSAVL
jgi:hypothetical protein